MIFLQFPFILSLSKDARKHLPNAPILYPDAKVSRILRQAQDERIPVIDHFSAG
jgi:type III secretory pathway component EscU